MQPEGSLRARVQKDMIAQLKHVVWRSDEAHLNALRRVIEKVMFNSQDDHELARALMEMLLTLDPKAQAHTWQLIFDECKERAFLFPDDFGYDFLDKINELGYKVFWLDFHSFRDIWIESPTPRRKGLIASNESQFNELCSKVFAAAEDPQYSGIRRGRVFRRLKEKDGCVKVECTFHDGTVCTGCEAESLSFRGLYSKKCSRKVGDKLKAKLIPIVEFGKPRPKHEFLVESSVAKLHGVEGSEKSEGRGIFFVDAEDDVVKSMYEYISEHRK